MGSEVLLYGYGLVCISMLVFNGLYSLHLRSEERRLNRKVARIDHLVSLQLQLLSRGQPLDQRHLRRLGKKLARVNNLLAFDHFLEQQDSSGEIFQSYLKYLQPVFLHLAAVYRRREDTQAAYFCHFLSRHQLQRHMQMDQIQQVVASYLERDGLYCRVNALKALCAFGSPDTVAGALLIRERRQGAILHEKVITETLLSYTGDARRLIALLWARFDQYPLPIQRGILDYIRFKSGDYCPQMLEILQNDRRDKELRLAAIRYFGRYPYPPARGLLLTFVSDQEPAHWEFAAISASALVRYPGQEVTDALSQAMHSSNWYVRYNAAASLEASGLSYEELFGVVAGSDRYAREMLTYRLEERQRRQKRPGSLKGEEVPAAT